MHTPICERLDIDVAIFAFSQSREVVAAVSNAGGMGVLGTVRRTPEQTREDLAWLAANTDKPFGVDIVYPGSEAATGSPEELRRQLPAEHVAFVEGLKEKYGIPDSKNPSRTDLYSGQVLTMAAARAHTDAALSYDVPLVVSALGVPPKDVIDRVHERDGLVGALIGSPRHAKHQVEAGVDVLVAQGTEAGGHVGQISTLVLIPQIVDAVPGTPVLAAGGIGDGRQIAAVEALGAQGAWLGSLWLTTRESITPDHIKKRLLEATSEDTTITRAYSGRTVRLARTPWLDAWSEPGAPTPLKAPLQGALVHDTMTAVAEVGVDGLATSPVGQVVAFMNEEEPVAAVMERLVAQYRDARTRLA